MKRVSAYVTPIRSNAGRFDGGVYDLNGDPIEAALHRRSAFDNVHQPAPASRDEIDSAPCDADPYLYAGLLFNHFGHFLIESLGRLWATRTDTGKGIKILYLPVWGVINVRNGDHYIGGTLNALDVDSKRVAVLTTPTVYTNLWIPEQLYGFSLMQNTDRRMVDLFYASSPICEMDETKWIYVSRSRLDIKLGRMAGEEEFERYMTTQGYEIFHPEQTSFPEQIRHYSRASRLVFSEGSAMHAALLFAATKSKIAVVLRRPGGAGWIKRFFSSIHLNVDVLDYVRRHDVCGLASHMGVSIVDLRAASERLVEFGFVQDTFSYWPLVKNEAVETHYRLYIERVGREIGFAPPGEWRDIPF